MVQISKKASGLILVALLLTFSACSNGGGGATPPPSGPFTEDYLKKARQASPLTKALIARAIAVFKGDQPIIPDLDLIFDDYKDIAEKIKDLEKLNFKGKAVLADIIANCKIEPSIYEEDGEWGVGKTLKTVDTMKVSGDGCPLGYINTTTSEFTTTKLNNLGDSLIWSAHGSTTNKSDTQVLRQDLFDLVNVMRIETELAGSFKYDDIQISGASSEGRSKKKPEIEKGLDFINGLTKVGLPAERLYHKVTGKIKITESGDLIHAGEIGAESLFVNGKDQAQSLLRVWFPEGEFVVGVGVDGEKKTIVVNGQEYTAEQLEEQFGIEIDELF